MQKVCNACGATKPIEDFSWKHKAKSLRQERCKPCSREYNKSYYHSKQGEKQKAIARSKSNRDRWSKEYSTFKQSLKCTLCDEDAPECIHLHHIDPETKTGNVSDLVGFGQPRLKSEIEKCIPVCANCHLKIHSGRIKI
jgi:hypothetical protein